MKLTIELVPKSVWNKSIYRLNPRLWKEIKKKVSAKEGKKCWICESEEKVSAHEFWSYDIKKKVQRLEAVHHLCSLCHKVKHIRFWTATTEGEKILKQEGITEGDIVKHFCKINNCSVKDYVKAVKSADELHSKLSKIDWK